MFSLQSYFDSDRQLALYQLGVQDMFDDVREVDLVWHYLMFDKEIRSRRAQNDLSKLRSEIAALIQIIERAEAEYDFQAKETGLCDWCEYQSLCPKRMHIVKTGQMPLNKYLNDPGVLLVNHYVEKIKQFKRMEESCRIYVSDLKERE